MKENSEHIAVKRTNSLNLSLAYYIVWEHSAVVVVALIAVAL